MTAVETQLVVPQQISPAAVENLLLGDLSKLTTTERVAYITRVCESLGLNPLTKPFEYILLNGRLRLYATKDATEQLRKLHRVSVAIASREVTEDCYVVTARATDGSGRSDESIGAVSIAGLKGEARSNAMMKAETKAKRRVTLSICGLGMLDENEVDSIPGARHVEVAEAETVEPAYRATVQDSHPHGGAHQPDLGGLDHAPAVGEKPASIPSKKNGRTKGDYLPSDRVPPKSPGKLATFDQLKEIRELKKVIGWDDWANPKEPHYEWPKEKWPTYRKAIGYRKVGGGYCHHANELQEHQADNLLRRMRAQAERNGVREQSMAADMSQAVTALGARWSNLDDALDATFKTATEENEWIDPTLGFLDRSEIPRELHLEVIQLLSAKAEGPEAYAAALVAFQEKRK